MLSKNTISYVKSLYINKYRKMNGQFIVEGNKMIHELLQSSYHYTHLFATENYLDEYPTLNNSLDSRFSTLSQSEMKQISHLTTPPGVLAVVDIPTGSPDMDVCSHQWVLALDGINDPGNLGTIIRTADWFGIRHIFCSRDTVDAFHPKVVQSTMGSVFRVVVSEIELIDLLQYASKKNLPVLGAMMKGEPPETMSQLAGILLIGSESHGIRNHLLPHISHPVTIPRFHSAVEAKPESLNAAVAAGILMAVCRGFEHI